MTTNFSRSEHATKWIAVKDLCVKWARAQRDVLNERHADEIAKNFDPDMFGVVSVTAAGSDGKHHVIDGMHRVFAVRKLWGEDELIPCNVFNVDDPVRAAQIFDKINSGRKPINAIDLFRVRVTGGSELEISVNKIVSELGYKISATGSDGSIRAVQALVSVFRQYGGDTLKFSLLMIRQTWGKSAEGVDANLIRGYAAFLNEFGGRCDKARLMDRISKQFTPGRLLGAAKTAREIYRDPMPENVKRGLINTYNHGLRAGRLGEAEVA